MKRIILCLLMAITLRQTTFSQQILRLIAGREITGYYGDGDSATKSKIAGPLGITSKNDSLFFVDAFNGRVRGITPGGLMFSKAGNGLVGYSGDGGQANNASFNNPWAIERDELGIIVSDFSNNRVRRIDNYGLIKTIAGNGVVSPTKDGVSANSTAVSGPLSLCRDSRRNLYIGTIADIRKVDSNNIISTVLKLDPLKGKSPLYVLPYGLKISHSGENIIFSDGFSRIFEHNIITGITKIIAGNDSIRGFSGDNDLAINATLDQPHGIEIDNLNNIYFAEMGSNRIRRIDAITKIITTVAGKGTPGFAGVNGLATDAELYLPYSLHIDAKGRLLIGEIGSRILMIDEAQQALPIKLISFNGKQVGNNSLLSWDIAEAENGAKYELERSNNGTNFNSINLQLGNGMKKSFSYVDQLSTGGNVYYRLKMIDIDGKVTYSPVLLLKVAGKENKIIIYPNPVLKGNSLQVTVNGSPLKSYTLVNNQGQVVLRNEHASISGVTAIPLLNLPAGIYSLRMVTENSIKTERVIIL